MNVVEVGVSPKQLSKLRNGHKVRVKKAMSGEGVCMIVNPSKYDIITRAFSRGKGAEISLSPDEIASNLSSSSQMEGKGIFGKKFDKMVEKTIGKKAKDVVYKGASKVLKPLVNKGIDKLAEYAPQLGADALSSLALAAGQPELVPFAAAAGSKIGKFAGNKAAGAVKDYIDKPTYYQEQVGVGGSGLKKMMSAASLVGDINAIQGTNMGYMERAGLGNARALRKSASLMKPYPKPSGEGLYAGKGLYAANIRGEGCRMCNRNSKDLIAGKGVRVLPQALLSQPYSANFQFRNTLPPAYQMIGKGLYA